MYKEHIQINLPLGRKDRHELVAQMATAVRSKVTMLLAFKPIPPTQSNTFDTPVVEYSGIEPES